MIVRCVVLLWCAAAVVHVIEFTQPTLNPYGVQMTSTGLIVFSCVDTQSIYCYDPSAATGGGDRPGVVHLGGPPRKRVVVVPEDDGPAAYAWWNPPRGLLLSNDLRCLWVTDTLHHRISRVSLPPNYFALPPCCERDR